jgi:hypothetical protein
MVKNIKQKFDVLTQVTMKVTVLWKVESCSSVDIYEYYSLGGTCCPRLLDTQPGYLIA